MKNTLGFIGTGNMGSALAKAAAKALPACDIYLANRTFAKAEALAAQLGCKAVSVQEAANCGYILLGVKPQMMQALLYELRPMLEARPDDFVLVSMAAGLTMEDVQNMAGDAYPVIRIMPNTPVAVGSGTVLYDATDNVAPQVLDRFLEDFRFAGALEALPEALIDAGSAICGCGPAFACLFIEALADGGVLCGLPREKALEFSAQMLEGTAKLMLAAEQHPAQMKDAVCSPGGSTIAGVQALENGAFRAALMQAVAAAYARTKQLGK